LVKKALIYSFLQQIFDAKNLADFISKEERDKIGVEWKCRSKEHFWIKSRWSYECKNVEVGFRYAAER
jgi:hypothetical protein